MSKKSKVVQAGSVETVEIGGKKINCTGDHQDFLAMMKQIENPQHRQAIISPDGRVFRHIASIIHEAWYKKRKYEMREVLEYVADKIHQVINQWKAIKLTMEGLYQFTLIILSHKIKLPRPGVATVTT